MQNNFARIKIHFYQQGNEKTKIKKNKEERMSMNKKTTLNGAKQEKKEKEKRKKKLQTLAKIKCKNKKLKTHKSWII